MKRSTNSMDNTPLHAALAGRRSEVAKLLIEHGADINNIAGGGWTPLHLASANGDAEMVEVCCSLAVRTRIVKMTMAILHWHSQQSISMRRSWSY